ncbi:MAG: site-2 protease family protein [Anaerolineales bacterium]|nr:site-2 protease family protein [Anaerolineales bacterium]
MENTDLLDVRRLVEQVLQIERVTLGTSKEAFVARYRGRLLQESDKAYDQLAEGLEAYQLIPVFRKEGQEALIMIVDQLPEAKPSRPLIHLALFIATLFSMILAGVLYSLDEEAMIASGNDFFRASLFVLPEALAFAVCLLAILAAHEFGHYLMARRHGTDVSLPYFLPFPGSPFGTLGAFIQLKEPPKNKRILLDIGLAGPVAGMVIAIPVLLIGLSLSEMSVLPTGAVEGMTFSLEGNSILYMLLKYMIKGEWLPQPINYGGIAPWLYWVKYILFGRPLPLGGMDILLHPVAWAGWAGFLVTGLNLIPVGQLDGGHVLYGLFGERTRRIWPVAVGLMVAMGFVWSGWWLWAGLIFLFGRMHAEPMDGITDLDPRRRTWAWFGLLLFILVFIPVPLQIIQ